MKKYYTEIELWKKFNKLSDDKKVKILDKALNYELGSKTKLENGLFGGTEVVFMNYSLKGTLQSVFLSNYQYVREATNDEINKFGHKFPSKIITSW